MCIRDRLDSTLNNRFAVQGLVYSLDNYQVHLDRQLISRSRLAYETVKSAVLDNWRNKKMLNNKKENKRLPMPGKVKKGFRCYCTLVMAAALLGCCSMTAFAADDPLEVVNNLSEFIFGLIRAVGLILLGWGIVQVGLSLQSLSLIHI